MKIVVEQMEGGITRVDLEGRMDIEGVAGIEDKFTFATATRQGLVVVNVADVPFMSSIGIRTIIVAGRAQKQRGGKFVLAAPQPMVRKVLVTAGIDQLVPLYDTVDAACEALRKA